MVPLGRSGEKTPGEFNNEDLGGEKLDSMTALRSLGW